MQVQGDHLVGEAASMVKLTVNGKEVEVPGGTTILHAAAAAGFSIPTFCYNPRMDPAGSCRICAVELEDTKRTVMGCITQVSEGMKVLTESSKVHEARKTNLELLLLHHPLDCPVCDCGGECPLQNMSFSYGGSDSRFESHRNDEPEDMKSEVLVFNSNRCILCGKCVRICDEIQDVHAIGFINRGFDTVIGPPLGKKLDCEFCGDCMEVCPTGAITDRFVRYQFRPWQMERTETTCTSCSSGCRMVVDTENEAIVRISSKEGLGPNEGSICVVGRFGYSAVQSKSRLEIPHVKKAQRLVPTSWEEILPEISSRLSKIASTGPGRVAGLISSQLPLEDAFVFQRFMRQTLQSNFLDSEARQGLMNMAIPLVSATGSLRPLVDHEDILKADLIVVLGADPAVESNITGLAIKKAVRKNKAALYLVHGRDVSLSTRAREVIRLAPGYEAVFLRTLREILSSSAEDLSTEVKSRLERWGANPEAVLRLAKDMKSAKKTIFVTGRRFHRSNTGFEASSELIRLLAERNLLASDGSGLFVLPESGNDLGVLMMGGTSEWLPGLLDTKNSEQRSVWENHWNCKLPAGGGGLREIISGIESGEIRALISLGVDPLVFLPDTAHLKKILSKLELIVVADMFQGPLADMAHYLLPSASPFERSGHVVSAEGFVQPLAAAMAPWGNALTEGELVLRLATHMNQPLPFDNLAAVSSEIFRIFPDLRPSTRNAPYFQGKTGEILLATPRQQPPHKAERESVLSRVPAFLKQESLPLDEPKMGDPSKRGEDTFVLTLSKSINHAGTQTILDSNLMTIEGEGLLRVPRQWARKKKLKKGACVSVSTPHGRISLPIDPVAGMADGEVHFPFHFADARFMALFPGSFSFNAHSGAQSGQTIDVTVAPIV